jgi:hypothetical protein
VPPFIVLLRAKSRLVSSACFASGGKTGRASRWRVQAVGTKPKSLSARQGRRTANSHGQIGSIGGGNFTLRQE